MHSFWQFFWSWTKKKARRPCVQFIDVWVGSSMSWFKLKFIVSCVQQKTFQWAFYIFTSDSEGSSKEESKWRTQFVREGEREREKIWYNRKIIFNVFPFTGNSFPWTLLSLEFFLLSNYPPQPVPTMRKTRK